VIENPGQVSPTDLAQPKKTAGDPPAVSVMPSDADQPA